MSTDPSIQPTRNSSSPSPQRYIALIVVFLLAAVLLSAALVWWARGRIRQRLLQEQQANEIEFIKPPPPREARFVGSESCRECHAEIADHYAAHPKSYSLSRISPQSDLEDFETAAHFAPIPERQYDVRVDGDAVTHHELGFDASGELIYDQGLAVDYGIGSGKRLRSYILDREGDLFLSPISWYSGSDQWNLSPGYEQFPHARFETSVSEHCVHCHAGHYDVVNRNSTTAAPRFQQPPFREMAISCERCHGPGEDHVRVRREGGQGVADDPMIKLSELAPSPRDSVCNQCHIHGDHQILRLGRRYDDFRPGDHVGDIFSLFVGGETPDRPTKNYDSSPAEQMQASRCYVASDREMGCTTCHDPHRVPDRSDLAGYYRQRCFRCHNDESCSLPVPQQQAAPAAGSCVACHMPTRDDIPLMHVTRTDHRILRDPSSSGEGEAAGSTLASLPKIFDLADCRLTNAEEARARGLMLVERAARDSNREYATQAEALLARTIDATRSDGTTQPDVRSVNSFGIALAILGRAEEAVELLDIATTLDPTRKEAWYELLIARQTTGDHAAARQAAERLVRLNPWISEMHGRHAQTLIANGQPEAAILAAKRALELDPSSLPTWALLVTLHEILGNAEEMAAAQQMLERLTGEAFPSPLP